MEETVKAKKPRKRVSRLRKTDYRVATPGPAKVKELWKDPVWRAALLAKRAEAHKRNPGATSRAGIPDGMHRDKAKRLWRKARKKAKRFIQIMEDEGHLPKVVVPGSDEEKAKLVLEEMATICLGPSNDQKNKIAAGRVVLEWTKSKPVQKQEMAITSAENWLKEVIEDNNGPADDRRTEGGS